uniref:GOLD domain-containing protein n=1 Tax=Elaeophora elaphi TaxID=1147741 RepID=A0A0R3RQW1_9BILA
LLLTAVAGTVEELRAASLTPASDIRQHISTTATPTNLREDFDDIFSDFAMQMDNTSEEAMSVTTNISEEEQQLMMLGDDAGDDDIFVEEIAVGEEAFADEVNPKRKKMCKDSNKQVNVVSTILSDLNVVVSSLNNASQGAGYITKIAVQQYINKELGDIYVAINSEKSCDFVGSIPASNDKTIVKFQFHSLPYGQSLSLKMQIEGFRATLDDIILSHLSAFIYDNEKTDVPLNLKINVADTQITVRNPKAKSFRIKLNDCIIEQAEEDDATIQD